MSNQFQSVHLDKSGSITRPKTQSPKVINALSRAHDTFTRTVCGSIILGLLTIAYLVALCKQIPNAHEILVVVGSALGFLLGGRERGGNHSE